MCVAGVCIKPYPLSDSACTWESKLALAYTHTGISSYTSYTASQARESLVECSCKLFFCKIFCILREVYRGFQVGCRIRGKDWQMVKCLIIG